MTQILLVGTDEPLLEGLAQSLAALGHTPRTAHSLAEARELAAVTPPMVVVVDRALATGAMADALGIPLASGGALLLYRTVGSLNLTLPHAVQRQVLANLTLPLERNRLAALVQHVRDRARATGRGTPPESVAPVRA